MKKVSIVFPLYNEEARLNKLFINIKKFEEKNIRNIYEYIFVDDGSFDKTVKKIKIFFIKNKKIKKKFKLIRSEKNFGKGHALKLGIKSAKYDWIFTIDGDLSVDLPQITQWFKRYLFNNDCAYFGSRNHIQSNVKKKYYRKFLGDIFQIFVFFLIDNKIKDSQCGFKLYNKKYAKYIFKRLKTNGFAHDLEIIKLLINRNIKIIELPVKWTHMDKGKLNVFFDPIKMLFDIILIKFR